MEMSDSLKSIAKALIIFTLLIVFLVRRILRDAKYSLDFPGAAVQSQYVLGRRGNEDKIPPVFPNGWYALKESKDVPIGKTVYVQALGQHFVVFRGENGVASVADAWCPHLGANLGVGSVVVDNCIRCPFHHWTFDGTTGECTSVPYVDKAPTVAKLKIWRSLEISGCVLVWYHADNEEPTWFPKPVKEIENKEVVVKAKSLHITRGHIQDVFENLSDFAHFFYMHRPGVLSGHKDGFYESFWNRIMWIDYDEIEWRPSEDETTKHEAYLTVKQRMTFLSVFSSHTVTVNLTQSGPGLLHVSMDIDGFGKVIMEIFYVPVEPLKSATLIRTYGTPGFKTTFYMPLLQKNIDVMSLRDMEIWARKCYLDKPVLAKGEKINQFRRWFSQFYSQGSPKLTKWSNSLDW